MMQIRSNTVAIMDSVPIDFIERVIFLMEDLDRRPFEHFSRKSTFFRAAAAFSERGRELLVDLDTERVDCNERSLVNCETNTKYLEGVEISPRDSVASKETIPNISNRLRSLCWKARYVTISDLHFHYPDDCDKILQHIKDLNIPITFLYFQALDSKVFDELIQQQLKFGRLQVIMSNLTSDDLIGEDDPCLRLARILVDDWKQRNAPTADRLIELHFLQGDHPKV
ncbi:hypothetical protein QR680_014087 [Steinernema hermaphroditum]|uniref:Uncharacterized protein n=1 Tax=Steinernema hermaphroditum TaxID=289476 RepID=A0AA39M3A5_9BILA|nr:hypothetical protein QR680_014087 [Steinernema hermaphroditum]